MIIIGGGPTGTAALWALERAEPGIKSVLIEQSDRLGAGSSLASLECYRTCWPAECQAALMMRSVEVFHHADDYLGEGASAALALKEQGYLFCAFNESHAQTLYRDVARLHQIGLTHIEYLDSNAIAYRFPWLDRIVIAAKFDPVAGWLDSNSLIHCYARSASNAQILLGIQNVAIRIEGARVSGVQTPDGFIAAPNVVIAAGANAAAVGRTAGIDLPVIVRPRQSFTTPWRHDGYPATAPMIIGGPPFPHTRPEAGSGAIFGWEYSTPGNPSTDPVWPVETLKDPRFPSLTLALLARQFGHRDGKGFASPRYWQGVRHSVGYYVYRSQTAAYRVGDDGQTIPYDSERAIMGDVPGVEGLFVSTAHAGHGIMSSPAAGEIIACKVLGRELPDPSLAAFGMDVTWVEHDNAVL